MLSLEQFSFLLGLQIHDAISVAQESLNTIKTKKNIVMILKKDLI